MRSKTMFKLFMAGMLSCAFGLITDASAGDKITLRLAYTSDSNGYIDACG